MQCLVQAHLLEMEGPAIHPPFAPAQRQTRSATAVDQTGTLERGKGCKELQAFGGRFAGPAVVPWWSIKNGPIQLREAKNVRAVQTDEFVHVVDVAFGGLAEGCEGDRYC